jgi:hypothetical protein
MRFCLALALFAAVGAAHAQRPPGTGAMLHGAPAAVVSQSNPYLLRTPTFTRATHE